MGLQARRFNIPVRRAMIDAHGFRVVADRANHCIPIYRVELTGHAEEINIRASNTVIHRPGNPVRLVWRFADDAAAVLSFTLILRDTVLVFAAIKDTRDLQLSHVAEARNSLGANLRFG